MFGIWSLPCTWANDKLEVTELKGGSVMTDGLSATELRQPLKWFVINDPFSPVRLENVGVVIVSQRGSYHYASRGIATAQSTITEMEVHFMLFDIHGNPMKTLSRIEKIDLAPGASFLLDRLEPWKAVVDEVKAYSTSVSFVVRVRKAEGEWSADTEAIMREVQALKPKLIHQ
jgi:hypothetical protein